MRTIKFRGKMVDGGEWIYGYLSSHNTISVEVKDESVGYFTHEEYFIAPSTVGQFTGLHDKNGKEIYEGDVLKSDFGDGKPTQILFGEYKDCSDDRYDLATNIGFYWLEQDGYTYPFGKSIDGNMNYCEVIGNIYENPELLNN